MKKSVKKAGAKSAKNLQRSYCDPAFVHEVAGMIETAAMVVGLSPREIVNRVIDSVREPDFSEGFEKRTIELELPPSDWKALEELAWADNGGESASPTDLSCQIYEAVTSRFTAKELATMSTGGSIEGIWNIQAATEHEGARARKQAAERGAKKVVPRLTPV